MDDQRLTLVRDESGPTAGVGVLWLRPLPPGTPLVVLNRALLRAIDAAMDELEADPRPLKGFVLASDSRVFIAGADLKEIMALSDPELHEHLRFGQRVYARIATLACTSVAAINGAALGGGLEIAMHCDHLIAAAPASADPSKPARAYPIGLPEAGLSICPGWGGTNLLPARMDPERAVRMTATGTTFTVVEAREAGLIEELVAEPARLLLRAKQIAATPKAVRREAPIAITGSGPARAGDTVLAALGKMRQERAWGQAALAVFECVETGLKRGWGAALDAEREHLVRLRNTEQGRGAIKAFLEKSGAKS